MALIVADRIQETSTTVGAGAYTLLGATTGYRAASTVCANGDTFTYYAEDIDALGRPLGGWETGLGTWGTGNILTRTTIYASSNANAAVSWAAGTRKIGLGLVATAALGPTTIKTSLDLPTTITQGGSSNIVFPSRITTGGPFFSNLTAGIVFDASASGAAGKVMQIANTTSSLQLGYEGTTPGAYIIGTTANDGVLQSQTPLTIGINYNKVGRFTASGFDLTGALTVSTQIQATGLSTSWGVTSGVSTGGFNAVMGTAASATWLLSGTSGGVFRGGLQLLDSGANLRSYVGTQYYDFNSSGQITSSTALVLNSTSTNAVTIDSGTTGAISIGTNANAKTITIGNATGATSVTLTAGTGGVLLPTGNTKIGQTTLAQGGAVTVTLPATAGTLYTGSVAPVTGGVIWGASTTQYGSTAVGTAGQLLVSNAGAAPAFASFDLSVHAPDSSWKKIVRLATNGDVAASTFAANILSGYSLTAAVSSVSTAASTTLTLGTTAAVKTGAVISVASVYVPATLTVTVASATTLTLSAASKAVATTAAAGTGTVATLTFAAQTYAPYAVGASIVVAGVTPVGFNGTFTVTACTTTTVSYANVTVGPQTIAGTVTQTVAAGTASLTYTNTIAALTVDGVAAVLNDRILLKDQSTLGGILDATAAKYNGIYYVSAIGSTAVPWTLTRAVDADAATDIDGAVVNVSVGTVNYGKSYKTRFAGTDVLNTTEMYWGRVVDVSGSALQPLQTTAVGTDITSDTETIMYKAGAVTDLVMNSFGIKTTQATAASTYTRASTVYIAGAPVASTNVTITTPYSLYVAGGNSYYGGNVTVGGSGGVASPTYATTTVNSSGYGFWGGAALSYGILMSNAADTTYGGRIVGETTSDYNMYFTMTQGTNRGFVFRNAYATPLLSINGDGVRALYTSAGTTDAPAGLRLHRKSSGVAAAGLGISYSFNLQDAGGNLINSGGVKSYWVDPAIGVRSSNTDILASLANSEIVAGTFMYNGGLRMGTGGVTDTSHARTLIPGGGYSVNTTASQTGAIAITLPVGMIDAMLRVKIKVYLYGVNTAFEVDVGGYAYANGNTWANNPFAYITAPGGVNLNYTIRLGYTAGGKAVIYIGELGTVWSYSQIFVTECLVGYNGRTASLNSGWVVGFQPTAFENVTATISNAQIGQLATVAPSALGTAAVGTSTLVARSDHVHAMPTAANVGAIANVTPGISGNLLTSNGSAWISQAPGASGATITDDNATATTQYIGMSRITTGAWTAAYVSSTKFTFNPSTGTASATVFNSTSDERAKENIRPLGYNLDTVLKLTGKKFEMKDSGVTSIGLIAQEVQQIVPEVVSTTDVETGMLGVNYPALVSVLIEAIKDLKTELDETNRKLNELIGK